MNLELLLASSFLLAISALVAPGCSNTEYCDCAVSGVLIDVSAGVTEHDVQKIELEGPCGPLPRPLCDGCSTPQDTTIPWEIEIPAKGTGVCHVAVTLADGETFERAILLEASDGCCAGIYGDLPLDVSPKK